MLKQTDQVIRTFDGKEGSELSQDGGGEDGQDLRPFVTKGIGGRRGLALDPQRQEAGEQGEGVERRHVGKRRQRHRLCRRRKVEEEDRSRHVDHTDRWEEEKEVGGRGRREKGDKEARGGRRRGEF